MLGAGAAERTEVGPVWCREPAQQVDPRVPRGTADCRREHADHALRDAGAPLGRSYEERSAMDVLVERCCGLGIHKTSVVACLLISPPGGEPVRAIRTFGTMTEDLLALADWLAGAGCTHVAMESTGVSWKPIWNLLEDGFDLLLANPRRIKAVPGRKTDVTD